MNLPTEKRAFYKRTRKGKVIRIVREKYLRSDLAYGTLLNKQVSREQLQDLVSQAPHRHLLLIDTNIALHQIDVLEYDCPATAYVVVVQTVLQELKNLNLAVYRRMSALLKDENKSFIFYANELSTDTASNRLKDESANDANDRAIVDAALYFQNGTTAGKGEVVFITNDEGNKLRAISKGLKSFGMREYVETFLADQTELLDLVALDRIDSEPSNAIMYPAHESMSSILAGLKSRRFLRGTIRSQRDSIDDCYVVVHSSDGESRSSVSIKGHMRVNRAIDGDVVAVELLEDDISTDQSDDAEDASAAAGEAAGAGIIASNLDATLEAIEGLQTVAPGLARADGTGEGGRSSLDRAQHGRVVGIIRRNWRQYAGSLTVEGGASAELDSSSDISATVQFVAVDKKIPPILITTRRLSDLQGCRLLVAIDQWPANSRFPLGHYVSVLGKDGDKAVETQVLLHEFDVPHEAFSADVMACLPAPDWKITEEIVKQNGRVDLRHIPVVSIDPPGCKDIDDALHCVRLPNGRLEAGVHIADVTYFVQPDTPLDREAAHRSTSTYLVERRLDMLPGFLTTQLCSLRSKEDHLAFSVVWEMDEEGNIFDVRFCKSVIHSVASLTYDEAQAMLDSPNQSDPVSNSVNLLNKLARQLRERRIAMGALTLASPEVRFKFEDADSQNPTDVTMYALKEANALVEEWMLLANITVSKQMLRQYPTLAVLRRHQPPSREQFAPLLSAALSVGVHLDISSSKALADSLDRAVRPDDPYFNKLLRILSTRCMMPAQYFCSGEISKDQWHHYGLAAPVYTHFTSPIRRYADVLVHRLLAASIGVIALPSGNADRGKQQDLCSHMNRRHRAAQHAQRASVNLHTLIFFKNRPSTEPAYVLSMNRDTLSVLVPRFGIEGSIQWDAVCAVLAAGESGRVEFSGEGHFATVRGQARRRGVHRQQQLQSPSASGGKPGGESRSADEALLQLKVFQQVQVTIKVREAVGGNRRLVVGLLHQGADLEQEYHDMPPK